MRPNEGTIDVGLSVWLPGTELAAVRGVRPQPEMTDDDLAVQGVRYERLDPMRRWRLTADCAEAYVRDLANTSADQPMRFAPLSLELEFNALTPAIGSDGQDRKGEGASAATRQSVGKGHLEQAGKWTGWIEFDGNRWELGPEARGNRDKSWGPRRWGGPKMWRWFSINIDDDTHFGGIRIGTDAGDLHRGWVWRDGEHASVAEWKVRTELEPDGVTHRVSHVTAVDKQGREHELRADLLRVDRGGGRTGTIVNEGLARWTYEGRAGYGISEYLHQLDDNGRPKVPIE